jgi:hypothetical protein
MPEDQRIFEISNFTYTHTPLSINIEVIAIGAWRPEDLQNFKLHSHTVLSINIEVIDIGAWEPEDLRNFELHFLFW